MVDISKVRSAKQISEVVELARVIWTDHYAPIIGQDQVDYMLGKFQSENAIAAQLEDGYEYYTVSRGGRIVGYLAIVPHADTDMLMISKIYVLRSGRDHGFGRAMLEFAEDICRVRGISTLCLTVNKNNRHSIAWYTRMGFKNVGSIVQDIGGGFLMDDYRMEKTIGQQLSIDMIPKGHDQCFGSTKRRRLSALTRLSLNADGQLRHNMSGLSRLWNAVKNCLVAATPSGNANATGSVGGGPAADTLTRTVDELMTMLQSESKWKRHEALLEIMKGHSRDDRFIPALGEQIRHDNMNLSSYAEMALGAIATERAASELCDLYESCPDKRQGIVSALENSSLPRARQIVGSFRKEQALNVQQADDDQALRQVVKSDPNKFIAEFDGDAKAFCQVAADIRQHWQEDREGSWSVSENLYRAAIAKWPGSWYGYFGLGENLCGQTRRAGVDLSPTQVAPLMTEAIKNLEKSCPVADSPEPFIQLAAILVRTDRHGEARDLFQRGDALGVHEDKLLYSPNWLARFFWDFAIGASTSRANLRQEAVRAFVCAMKLNTDYVTLYAPQDSQAEVLWLMAKAAL